MTDIADSAVTARHSPFSADLPISSAKQDLLNRSTFAAAVARAILGWREKTNLVIGLFGDWGSGKSSLKNMILESLRGASDCERPVIVEFNPWQINDRDRLIPAFFNDIGIAVSRSWPEEDESKARRRAAKWEAYGSYLSLGAWIVKSLKVMSTVLGLPVLSPILEAIQPVLAESGQVAKEGAEGVEASARALTKTLTELKKEVHEALESFPRPILVVLDDVDRLARDEICSLFQLIKANADFPNVIYLVLAQRETVVKALEQIAPDHGEGFLEKIVQVPLNVPRIERPQLEKVLFEGLDCFLAQAALSKRFDRRRWVPIYADGLRVFFENLRDVNRFLSSFGFHVGVFRSGDSFEVNPVDLIAIEVLRVFLPNVYDRLPDMKHILTDQPRFGREEELEHDRAALEGLLNPLPDAKRRAVRSILENLFPPAEAVLADSHFSGGDDDWVRNLRICSHLVFDRYFQFAIPSGDISQAELKEVIAMLGNRDALRRKFADLKARGLLDVLLERLEYHQQDLPRDAPEEFLTALLDLEVAADDEPFALRLSAQTHLLRIVYRYLRQEPDQTKRKEILQNALRRTNGLATPVAVVNALTRAPDRDALFEQQSDIAALRKQAVDLIKAAASSGRLAKEKRLGFLLAVWYEWDAAEEVGNWVGELVGQPEGVQRLLRALKSTRRSYAGPIREETHYYKLTDVEKYIDTPKLSSLVESLPPDDLAPEDQENVKLFREALERRAQGKPDDPF